MLNILQLLSTENCLMLLDVSPRVLKVYHSSFLSNSLEQEIKSVLFTCETYIAGKRKTKLNTGPMTFPQPPSKQTNYTNYDSIIAKFTQKSEIVPSSLELHSSLTFVDASEVWHWMAGLREIVEKSLF